MSEDILLTVSERIATLTFNRPASLNSLSLGSIQSLLQHLRDLSVRSDVRALVITGQGRGFCAGWQLDMDQVPGIAKEVRHAHHAAQTNTLSQQMDVERQRQRVLLDTPHFREGVAAFVEKREPKFGD